MIDAHCFRDEDDSLIQWFIGFGVRVSAIIGLFMFVPYEYTAVGTLNCSAEYLVCGKHPSSTSTNCRFPTPDLLVGETTPLKYFVFAPWALVFVDVITEVSNCPTARTFRV
ncbi:unnamed protein product [Laminaria digitata]